MQAETDIMFLACLADTRGTRIVEAGEGVVGVVELDVDVADIVSGRPCDGLLEPETAPDVDTGSCRATSFPPSPLGANQFSRNQLITHPYFRRPFFSPAQGKTTLDPPNAALLGNPWSIDTGSLCGACFAG
jgi:hypothetical protein